LKNGIKTIEGCYDLCKGKKYSLFGLQYPPKGECFCSNDKDEAMQFGKATNCQNGRGGSWSLDIYEMKDGDIVDSLTIYVSDVKYAETSESITVSIWHRGKAYQVVLDAPSRGEVYTFTEDDGLTMIASPEEMFDETTILVDNNEKDAPILDKMKFTTAGGDWYGWDSVCASSDKPYTAHTYGELCSSNCAECPSTNMAEFDHICVDNQANECGPSKQLLTLDDQRPNEYVAAIWEDGSS